LLGNPRLDHLSAYELTLAEGTPLWDQRSTLALPSEDAIVEMASIVESLCRESGLYRYEISNYAKAGHECRHNLAYWRHEPYVGLGPGAHSYIHPRRWANNPDLNAYVKAVGNGLLPQGFSEELSDRQLAHEMIMLGLRTAEGIDEVRLEERTGMRLDQGRRGEYLGSLAGKGMIVHQPPSWKLTSGGMLIADAITREIVACE
jgi:oxygen-independent coproporphyrinogen-3 oxidase